MNKERILDAITTYNALEEYVYETLANKYAEIHDISIRYIDEVEFTRDEIKVSATIPTGCGCCTDYESFSIPTEYLWMEDWEEVEKVRMADRKRRDRKKELREKEQREKDRLAAEQETKEKQERAELREYMRLKEKFEKG
jgi:hypothetical protein